MMLILMSNCKVWIVVVASSSFYFCWIVYLIKVTVLWDFQSKDIVVESFDMIIEENNVLLVVNKDDYPQKLNMIVEI
jgi:hypothetical protein